MTCYAPLRGYRGRDGAVVFNRTVSVSGRIVEVACGQCIGCRVNRSRQWALRCMHEAAMWPHNVCVTLTYDNDHLPDGATLVVKHFQDFMKRLRKRFEPDTIRFYACGEYGEDFQRPHYHACLFNVGFADRYVWKKGTRGSLQFRSPTLEALWTFGQSSFGEMTFESAGYCARYLLQKRTGQAAECYEPHIDSSTGEVRGKRVPPFNLMSRRPGLGAGWFERFGSDAFPSDFLVLEGRKVPVPKYYDALYERAGFDIEAIKDAREDAAFARRGDNTRDRLKAREECAFAKLAEKTRSME